MTAPANRTSSLVISPSVPEQTTVNRFSFANTLATASRLTMAPIKTRFAALHRSIATVPLVVARISVLSATTSGLYSSGELPW